MIQENAINGRDIEEMVNSWMALRIWEIDVVNIHNELVNNEQKWKKKKSEKLCEKFLMLSRLNTQFFHFV